MLKLVLLCALFTSLVACQSSVNPSNDAKSGEDSVMSAASAPVAKKIPHTMNHHGHQRTDNYFWMRDDQRKDAAVLSHLEAENAYAKARLAHTEDLQQTLFDEMTMRMKKDDSTVPVKQGQHFYYSRYEGDNEYPVYVRKQDLAGAQEEVLLDANVMAEGEDYFNLGDVQVSTNEQLLAYSTDTLSRRIYTIAFKDLNTGKLLEDRLQQTTGQVIWANDNRTVFYIRKDPQTLLGYQVYRHVLGTPQEQDVLVYEEKDTTFYTWLEKTKDNSTIVIVHWSTTSKGASILSADKPEAQFRPFISLKDGHEYSVDKVGEWFYVRTNWQAKNFRLMKVKPRYASNRNKWVEVLPHNPDVLLQDVELFSNYLAVEEKLKGQTRIRVVSMKDKRSHVITFDDPVYVASIDDNRQPDAEVLRLKYSSLTTPTSIYDYDMRSRERELLKQEEVVGDFDPSHYASERIFVKARDGEEVPVSIVYRKALFKKDGTNPLYQYGYGSYGHNVEPYFSGARLSLLDRGFVFAIAHVRGSQTLGRQWYESGKMFNKINTFTDFIDVTRVLVKEGYGAQDKVFATGRSAGGLLVGAVMNMAPELYRGVAAHVPFVDVVTTMLDASIPLTTNEYDEWGNPNEQASYEYMLSYSPYDNVKEQSYPNTLITTGLHDSQVQYFEPAKWVAKLREYHQGDNVILFDVNMEAGHGGASGRFRRYHDRAQEYAFFMDLVDVGN